jgi:hypothetical protein
MLDKLLAFIEELKSEPVILVYHNPDQGLPTLDFRAVGTVRLIPHEAVPKGTMWVVNNGPSGRIITEE